MAQDFTSDIYHLQTLLQADPKGFATSEHLRALRSRMLTGAERIEHEADALVLKATQEADRLRAMAASLPADFDAKAPTVVADYATYGSPDGNTPNGFPYRPRTEADRVNDFLLAANLVKG